MHAESTNLVDLRVHNCFVSASNSETFWDPAAKAAVLPY